MPGTLFLLINGQPLHLCQNIHQSFNICIMYIHRVLILIVVSISNEMSCTWNGGVYKTVFCNAMYVCKLKQTF